MKDLFIRAVISFAFGSFAVIAVRWAMEQQGMDSRFNPAWMLVSGLSGLFIWIWIVLICLGLLAGATVLAGWLFEKWEGLRREDRIRAAQEAQAIQWKAERGSREALEKAEELSRRERHLRESIEREELRLRNEAVERERLNRRSSDEATEDALDDFL